jgi:hypothetical protein
MKLNFFSPVIFVRDLGVTKSFYSGILKQDVRTDYGWSFILNNGVSFWQIDMIHIIPEKIGYNKLIDRGTNRFELYFETEDIDNDYLELSKNKVRFLHPVVEESWGQKTMRFFDPDGHLIEIGESVEIWVKRLEERGLTLPEISEKATLSEKKIAEILTGKNI